MNLYPVQLLSSPCSLKPLIASSLRVIGKSTAGDIVALSISAPSFISQLGGLPQDHTDKLLASSYHTLHHTESQARIPAGNTRQIGSTGHQPSSSRLGDFARDVPSRSSGYNEL
jgi:hypothetical protein